MNIRQDAKTLASELMTKLHKGELRAIGRNEIEATVRADSRFIHWDREDFIAATCRAVIELVG